MQHLDAHRLQACQVIMTWSAIVPGRSAVQKAPVLPGWARTSQRQTLTENQCWSDELRCARHMLAAGMGYELACLGSVGEEAYMLPVCVAA